MDQVRGVEAKEDVQDLNLLLSCLEAPQITIHIDTAVALLVSHSRRSPSFFACTCISISTWSGCSSATISFKFDLRSSLSSQYIFPTLLPVGRTRVRSSGAFLPSWKVATPIGFEKSVQLSERCVIIGLVIGFFDFLRLKLKRIIFLNFLAINRLQRFLSLFSAFLLHLSVSLSLYLSLFEHFIN